MAPEGSLNEAGTPLLVFKVTPGLLPKIDPFQMPGCLWDTGQAAQAGQWLPVTCMRPEGDEKGAKSALSQACPGEVLPGSGWLSPLWGRPGTHRHVLLSLKKKELHLF